MKVSLKVAQIDKSEIFRDFARIPVAHRKGIREGELCQVSYCQRSVYLAIRGLQSETNAVIKVDSLTREKLCVVDGQVYEFEIKQLNPLSQIFVTWHASDPFNRQAMRLGILGMLLGLVGLALGIISLFK
jgi:hypothetical protein